MMYYLNIKHSSPIKNQYYCNKMTGLKLIIINIRKYYLQQFVELSILEGVSIQFRAPTHTTSLALGSYWNANLMSDVGDALQKRASGTNLFMAAINYPLTHRNLMTSSFLIRTFGYYYLAQIGRASCRERVENLVV